MALRVELPTGRWWRFSRYELRDSPRRCIAPAPRANFIGYDPFERAGNDRPYLTLVQLARAFEPHRLSPTADPLRQAAEQEIIRWCNQYGLLGILFHRTVTVTLAARWTRLPLDREGKQSDSLLPASVRYICRNDAWLAIPHYSPEPSSRDLQKEGTLVPPDQLPVGFPQPGALMQAPFGEELRHGRFLGDAPAEQRLSEAWGDYFDNVPAWETDTFAYPQPRTGEFARHYVEPIADIMVAGLHLGSALDIIAQRAPSDPVTIQHGFGALGRLASYGVFALESGSDGALRQRWFAGSLLAAMAYMATQDLAKGQLRQCFNARCGRLFVSDAWQARYCSLRCQNATQARRFRQKLRDQRSAKSKSKRR